LICKKSKYKKTGGFVMKKNVRIVAGLLVALLFVTAIIPVNQGASAAEKPARIDAFLDIILTKEAGQEQFAAEYKKQTGIELRITQPAHNQYREKMLIAFASNDLPDVIEIIPDFPQDYMTLAKEGALVPLDKYIAKSPVFKNINKQYLNALKFRGKIYAVPLNTGGGNLPYIRKDWLDKLGLKAPTTWDEFYNVAKAFATQDPDGNGKHDTIGITLPGLDQSIYMQDFYQGAEHDFVYKKGRWVDGFVQPEFKKALERLRKAYQEKVLDPEVFTNKTSTCREKFYAGKVGIFPYWAGTWGETIERNVKLNNPKAEVMPLPAIKGVKYINRIGPMLAITKKAKNPEAVFKYFIEYMHDGGKGQMLFTHGVEGVHWAKKGNEYVKLPSLGNPNVPAAKSYIHPELPLNETFKDPFPLHPAITASLKAFQSSRQFAKLPPDSETYLKYNGEIMNLKKEIMAKVMMGTYTVDQGIQEYKAKSARLHVAKILQEANAR